MSPLTPAQRAIVEHMVLDNTRWLKTANPSVMRDRIAVETPALVALLAATEPPWQDIATAPKDRIIDVWLGNADESEREFYCCGQTRRAPGWAWRDGKLRPTMGLYVAVVTVQPTHWREIPAPPETGE